MAKMVKQMTAAIEYLHAEKILHLDIKPENFLFDHGAGDAQPNFYLGDFGLAMAEAEVRRVRGVGTDFYMDPEIAFALSAPGVASDIWSFAMTIGEALGFWCPRELDSDVDKWAKKLRVLGVKLPYTEPRELSHRGRQQEAFYRRIAAAVASGALPPMFSKMLVDQKHRPTAAACRHTDTDFFIKRPRNPEPLSDWDGANPRWLVNAPLNITWDPDSPTPPIRFIPLSMIPPPWPLEGQSSGQVSSSSINKSLEGVPLRGSQRQPQQKQPPEQQQQQQQQQGSKRPPR
jgi:serine/threonine protein kinase